MKPERFMHITVKNSSIRTSSKGMTLEEVAQGIYGYCQVFAQNQELETEVVQKEFAKVLMSIKENKNEQV